MGDVKEDFDWISITLMMDDDGILWTLPLSWWTTKKKRDNFVYVRHLDVHNLV